VKSSARPDKLRAAAGLRHRRAPIDLPMLACRAGALAKAGAQKFVQPVHRAEALLGGNEGSGKGGGVLTVREIGQVILGHDSAVMANQGN